MQELVNQIGHGGFGAAIDLSACTLPQAMETSFSKQKELLEIFYGAAGLLVLKGLGEITAQPDQLVKLSTLFGDEVENYRSTLTSPRYFHDQVSEILVLTEQPPCNHPPPLKTEQEKSGEFPIQFPDRANWHTDQSYRRPPPDITLLYGVVVPPSDQGRTCFANCTAAYADLNQVTKVDIKDLKVIHAPSWIGRSRQAVEQGETPIPLLPHQQPQKQPLVRVHPVSGQPALYLCEEKQLDYVDGPIEGLSPGPTGEGAALIRTLLAHATQPKYVYCHRWQPGDLVIADNRNQLHCATWYDTTRYSRLMWRTTVMGNPGQEYQGEAKSWLPAEGIDVMTGMEHA